MTEIKAFGQVIEARKKMSYTQPESKQVVTMAGRQAVVTLLTNTQRDKKTGDIIWHGEGECRLPMDEGEWSWQWMLPKGQFAGALPKRIAAYYFKVHNIKIPPALLAVIGETAKANIARGENFTLDFTDVFDWQDGDFGDSGSCFWRDRRGARLGLQDEGGIAVRFFEKIDKLSEKQREYRAARENRLTPLDSEGWVGLARAWCLPAHERRNGGHMPDVVFNGYGFSGNATLTIARLVATMFGMDYKKVFLTNDGEIHGYFWINGGSSAAADGHGYGDTGIGYSIGPAGELEPHDMFDLCIPRWKWKCASCNATSEDAGDMYLIPNAHDHDISARRCRRCWGREYTYCAQCDQSVPLVGATVIDGSRYCDACVAAFPECQGCHQRRPCQNRAIVGVDEHFNVQWGFFCVECYRHMQLCRVCANRATPENLAPVRADLHSENVWEAHRLYCGRCRRHRTNNLQRRQYMRTPHVTTTAANVGNYTINPTNPAHGTIPLTGWAVEEQGNTNE